MSLKQYSDLLRIAILAVTPILAWSQVPSGTPLTFDQFRDCISVNGPGHGYADGSNPYICKLQNQSSPYIVSDATGGTLVVGRSNIEVTGTYITSISDTTLQRGGMDIDNIMLVAPNVQYDVIEELQFDGNRCGLWGSGPVCTGQWPSSCHPPYGTPVDTYIDLETQALAQGGGSGYLTVMFVNFVNSPQQSMTLATESEVTYSNFSYAANSGVVTWTPASGPVTNANIDRNTFQSNGGSAIALQDVQSTYVAYNQMLGNENEAPDRGAGQLDIDPTSQYIYVLENTIDGQNDNNSCVGGVGPGGGIELWGSNVYVEGNAIKNHVGGGVVIGALGNQGGNFVYFQPDSYSVPNTIDGNGWDGVHIGNYSSYNTHDVNFTNTTITNNGLVVGGHGMGIDFNNMGFIYNIAVDAATINNMTGNRDGKILSNCGTGGYNCPSTQ